MPLILAALLFGLCLGAAPPAQAQLGELTPPVIPEVGGVLDALPEADEVAEAGVLRNARRLRIRDLLRAHRRELEADPDGQPIVRGQVLAFDIGEEALERARAAGFEVARSDDLGALGSVTVLRAPSGRSTRRALRQLREADPGGVYDFDHLHLESAVAVTAAPLAQLGVAVVGPRIGLIDTGVSARVSVAAQRAFVGETPVAGAHGTAVASLLAGAAPGARIYAADIYGGAPAGGAASALARALAWLAEQRTPVINVSLVGPRNRVVEAVVSRLAAEGHLLVAAVGNDGPAAGALYPAAYAGVVGVTAVDARGRALIEAGRGPHVDFAALGVLSAAVTDGGAAHVRGTSYAAPLVAGLLALRHGDVENGEAERTLEAVRNEARDLGAPGRDDIYGYGLVEVPSARVAAR